MFNVIFKTYLFICNTRTDILSFLWQSYSWYCFSFIFENPSEDCFSFKYWGTDTKKNWGGQEGLWGQIMNRLASYVRSLNCILRAVGIGQERTKWENGIIRGAFCSQMGAYWKNLVA